jgi:uncharacterized protein
MGFEMARLLAAEGYDLVLASNEEEKLVSAGKELAQAYNIKVLTYYNDLSTPGAAHALFSFCNKKNVQIDILINNAGFLLFGEVVNTDPDKITAMVNLHIMTPTLLCRLFGEQMKKRRSGYILNMSSISTDMPYPGIALYASTKRYLKHFSRALRSEMLDHNVSVTCICPGAVATNLYDRNVVDYKKAMRYGIMMRSDKVAGIALRALFKRKANVVPGAMNKIIILLVRIAPHWLILYIKRHSSILPAEKA